jgi:positive regulator of sigma E activity
MKVSTQNIHINIQTQVPSSCGNCEKRIAVKNICVEGDKVIREWRKLLRTSVFALCIW